MWTQMEKKAPELAEAKADPVAPETAPALLGQIAQAAQGDDGPRRPLDLNTAMRERMERQFGLDFSAVRLEESPLPGQLGADAVAQGDLIRFAPGAFQPDTAEGEQLLSHELGHLVRQSQSLPQDAEPGMPYYDPAAEWGADHMAQGVPEDGAVRAFSPVPAAQAPMEGNRFSRWVRNALARHQDSEEGDELDDLEETEEEAAPEAAPPEETPAAPAPSQSIFHRAGNWFRGLGSRLSSALGSDGEDGVELNDLSGGGPADTGPEARQSLFSRAGGWLQDKKQRLAAWKSRMASMGRDQSEGEYEGGYQFDVLRNIALQRRAERQAQAEAQVRQARRERRAARRARRERHAARRAARLAAAAAAPAAEAVGATPAAPAETPAAPVADQAAPAGGVVEREAPAAETPAETVVPAPAAPAPTPAVPAPTQSPSGRIGLSLRSMRERHAADEEEDGLELEDLDEPAPTPAPSQTDDTDDDDEVFLGADDLIL